MAPMRVKQAPALESAAIEAFLRDSLPPDGDAVVLHPDGYYWLADDGRGQFGPFATVRAALADMHSAADHALEPGETLEEAERELGLASWVDADTGELAEDTATRLEDH
jgi:hypothetical protein